MMRRDAQDWNAMVTPPMLSDTWPSMGLLNASQLPRSPAPSRLNGRRDCRPAKLLRG